jgi:hypothetical protein
MNDDYRMFKVFTAISILVLILHSCGIMELRGPDPYWVSE